MALAILMACGCGAVAELDGGRDALVAIDDLDAGSDASAPEAGSPPSDGGRDAGAPTDAGPDAGTTDAGTMEAPDAGWPDAGWPDAGWPDAGWPDAGWTDAGWPDAGWPDAGMWDAGMLDLDAGMDAGAAVNQPPTIGSVRITPSVAYETSTLTCTASGAADAEDDPITLTYAWAIDDVAIAVTTPTLGTESFARGDRVRCTVTPSDAFGVGTSVDSSTITIRNSPPTAPTVTIAGGASAGGDLTCTASGSTDDDGDAIAYTYAWSVDGASTSWTTAVVPSSETAAGQVWVCTVTPHDGTSAGTSSLAIVAIERTLLGHPVPLGDTEEFSANAIWAQYVRIDAPVTLERIGMIFAAGRGHDVQLALYGAGPGKPGDLIAETTPVASGLGPVTAPLTAPVTVEPGDYFIAWRISLRGVHALGSSAPTGRIYGAGPDTFTNPLPAVFRSGAYVYGITMNVFLVVR